MRGMQAVIVVVALLGASLGREAGAQTATPGHQHYQPPSQQTTSPAPGPRRTDTAASASLPSNVPDITFDRIRLQNGVRLNVAQRGPVNGPAVLMLHGYSDSWFSFSRVLPLLPAGMRVIVPDQRGHGDSDRPDSGYAMDDLATDAIQLMDALGVERAVVVGHSMGSLVARRVAERVPARVQRLVLVAGGLTIRNAAVEELRKEITALTDPVDPEFVRAFQLSTIHRPVPNAFVERVIQDSRKLPAHVWKALLAGMWNDEPATQTIRAETIVLAGAKDAVFSVAEQQSLAAAIPGATFKLLENIGHAVHWEDPQALAAVLENTPPTR